LRTLRQYHPGVWVSPPQNSLHHEDQNDTPIAQTPISLRSVARCSHHFGLRTVRAGSAKEVT